MKHPFFNPTEYKDHSKLQYVFAHYMVKSAGIEPTDRVLDIGCGDGKISADIAKMVPTGQVVGTDLSPQMIQHSIKEHTPNQHQNLGFMVMDAEANIFKKQFDIVVSFCCLHWVKDQLSALKGIKSSLVKNGKAVLLVPLRHEELYSAVEQTITENKWQGYFSEFTNPHIFFTKEGYRNLLDTAELNPRLLEESTMNYSFQTQAEMEMFLKAWLPHVKRVPDSLQPKFMHDIGNNLLKIIPKQDDKITMPLRMLKVHASASALSLSMTSSITVTRHNIKPRLFSKIDASRAVLSSESTAKLISKL